MGFQNVQNSLAYRTQVSRPPLFFSPRTGTDPVHELSAWISNFKDGVMEKSKHLSNLNLIYHGLNSTRLCEFEDVWKRAAKGE